MKKREKTLPQSGVGPMVARMATNPLIALRVALPEQPSLREMASRLGCSYEMLRQFELGLSMFRAPMLAKYAKLVGVTPEDAERRWLNVRLETLHEMRVEVENKLRHLGVRDPRVRRGRKSA